MLTIARSEVLMLVRNRLVALLAILTPLAFGGVLLLNADNYGSGGLVAGMQVIGMIALGTYATTATTLAARRQTLYLKRLRGGTIGDAGIIGGLVGPIVAISVIQVLVVAGVLASTSAWPANPVLVVAAVLAGEAMFVGFALATAGVTTSPEHAQVTTLPVLAVAIGAAIWIALTGFEDLAAVKRLIPGGGLMEWVMIAWEGGDLATLPWAVLPTLGWAVVALLAAKVMFTWEPRA